MRQIQLNEDNYQLATLVSEAEAGESVGESVGEKHLVAADLLRAAVRAKLYNATRKRQTIPLYLVEDFIAENIDVMPIVAFERADLLLRYRCNGSTNFNSGMRF